jgi:RND superfamily putative drug exporter
MLSNLAVRLSGHPRRTLLVLVVFVGLAGLIGGPVAGAMKSSGGFVPPGSDSQLAVKQLEAATGVEAGPGLALVVRTPNGAQAAAARIRSVARRLARVAGVVRVEAPAAVARDGERALVTGTIAAGADDSAVAQDAIRAFAGAPGVRVGGGAVADEQVHARVASDLGRAELIALPFLVLFSLVFFRGRAALTPLVVGATTVLGTFLAMAAINRLYGLNVFALNLVIGLGLGLAIDYSLFLVTRFREELARGRSVPEAIGTTMSRSGRTVVYSAVTVACAMATLTVFSQGFLRSMGLAGAAVALVAACTALVVPPALFGLWGAKLVVRGSGRSAHDRWARLARLVMRRPGAVAAVTALAMVALALPALGARWSPIDASAVPRGDSAHTVAAQLDTAFGGRGTSPVILALEAPRRASAAVDDFARRAARVPGVRRVAATRRVGATTVQLDVTAQGTPAGSATQRVVRELRALPAPFAVHVGGDAAEFVDQQAAIKARLPVAIGLLVLLTFLVLWLMTGSVVLPAKALVMNALTVGAALAPLTLIYQHGHLAGLLGYTPNGGVEPTDFLVAAALIFALSTDYGVFLLGRIKEAHDAGAPPREAIASGLGRTGRVVTAAAVLLAVAIGAFSTSAISFIQQIGVATATGVLVDAFVVRALLVPSAMALLGRWNWWSPAPARLLHRRLARPGPAAEAA